MMETSRSFGKWTIIGFERKFKYTAGCKVVVEIGVAVNTIQEAKPPFYSAFGLGKYRDK
jgi:hypothetical protein